MIQPNSIGILFSVFANGLGEGVQSQVESYQRLKGTDQG